MTPAGWRVCSLANVGLPSTPKIEPRRCPTEVFELYSVPAFEQGEPEIVPGTAMASARQLVQPGDVLLCKINPRINRVWVVGPRREHPQVASTEWVVVRSPKDDSRFLMHQMREESFRERLLEDVSGVGGSLMRARSGGIGRLPMRIAPLAEQRRIVARIETLFARTRRARADLERIASLSSQYEKSVRDSFLQIGQDAGWPERTLGEIASEVRNGIAAKPADEPPGIPILRISAVRQGRVILTDSRYHRLATGTDARQYLLRNQDLLFIRFNGNPQLVAACGMVRELEGECVYPDKLIRMRINQQSAVPDYVEMAAGTSLAREQLTNHIKTAAGQHGISGTDLKTLRLPMPDVCTQTAIAAEVTTKRNSGLMVQREAACALVLLDRLEQSILARAFCGELASQDSADAA